jgi:acyl-coenzyme A thioesterase PaaI-like protein
MKTVDEYRVLARNTATTSSNKIHDDAVARRYGFAGGLVPGVDVYAYMCHPPAEAWGLDWLERGSMRARFLAPVYEGEEVVIVADDLDATAGGRRMVLELRGPDGAVRATGEAQLPEEPQPAPPPSTPADDWPLVEQADDPPEASPASLAAGTALGLAPHGFHADQAVEYLAEIDEGLPLYADHRIAHPGWLLRDANRVLSANVRLGPWIHVESVTQHHGVVHDGDIVTTRARVNREWERKGHRFVELDVGTLDGDRLVAHVLHTAIYRPRPNSA